MRYKSIAFCLSLTILWCFFSCKPTTTRIALHTNMGDMVIKLKSTITIPDQEGNRDSSNIISILQDGFIQIPALQVFNTSSTTNNDIPASGALILSSGNYYLIQGRRYNQATLEKWEAANKKKLQPAARSNYLTTGGALSFEGNCRVIGTLISGKEVLDRIAALPCDENGRPLREVSCWYEF